MAKKNYDPTKDPHLATWQERGTLGLRRMRCPQCGKVGYKPYIHPDGTIVAEECGRCDHESSCGYHMSPSEWMKGHPDETDHSNPNYSPPPPPPVVDVPKELVSQYYCLSKGAAHNPLLRYWIERLRGVTPEFEGVAKIFEKRFINALRKFFVGSMEGGYTIWWIIDEQGYIRSGKAMKYKDNGHRDKESERNFLWMHRRPEVMARQKEGAEYLGCLFGLHQLKENPKEVHIVESEKTAVMMTVFRPDVTWMATMGLSCLNAFRLAPLIDRRIKIVCHPDRDGVERWQEKIDNIKKENPKAYISVCTYIQGTWLPGDNPKADILDMMERDYLLVYS